MHVKNPSPVKRKVRWNFSEFQTRQALHKVLQAAYAQVPYYRETYRSFQELAIPAVSLWEEKVARHYFQLFPFSQPLLPEEEGWPETSQQRRELFQTLLLTEHYSPRVTLFEIRDALMDLCYLGPFRQGKRAVLLSDQALVNPFRVPGNEQASIDDRLHLKGMKHYYLLGDCQAMKYWLTRLFRSGEEAPEPPTQLFLRLDCGETAEDTQKNMDEVYEVINALALKQQTQQLLFEPTLGYIGALNAICGHYHINWQQFLVQDTEQGIVYSKVAQKRPTIIHYQAGGNLFSRTGLCPLHSSPILVPII